MGKKTNNRGGNREVRTGVRKLRSPFRGQGVPKKIWINPYTRKDGTKVSGHHRNDLGAPGKTPKEKQWFKPEISLEGYNYDYDDKPETRQTAIREWAKDRGDTNQAWMKLFHHFLGLHNLTKKSQPPQARAYRQDYKYVDSVRERRFGSV